MKAMWELGVKINNIRMIMGTLKSVSFLYAESMRGAKEALAVECAHRYEQERAQLSRLLSDRLMHHRACDDQAAMEVMTLGSRARCLERTSVNVVEDLLGIFKRLLNDTEMNYLGEFLETMGASDYLRNVFQLAICLSWHDLDLAMTRIKVDRREDALSTGEFQARYDALLHKLFYIIFDAKASSSSTKSIKRLLNRLLKDTKLRIVNGFEIDSDDEVKHSFCLWLIFVS